MDESHDQFSPSFSFSRKFGVAFSVLIACLSVLAIVVMVNYLAARHFYRLDASTNQRTRLAPLTLRVLDSITNEVKITVYYDPQERLYREATSLLREYTARNPRLKLQLINPVNNPAEAQAVKDRYKLAELRDKDLVIFDCNGRIKSVYKAALSEYDLEPVANPNEREFRRKTKAFRGEVEFTSALVSVADTRQLKACFLEGHGEHNSGSHDEQSGYSKFAALLTENNLQYQALSLLGSTEVPPDCSLLIIAGPRSALSRDELEKIERYLNQGGRLLVAFGFPSVQKRTGLEGLLANWGLIVGENIIRDYLHSTPDSLGQDLVLPLTSAESHAITAPLLHSSVHLIQPRTIATIKSGRNTEGLRLDELLHTTPDAVLITTLRNGIPEPNPARDRRGAFSIIAAAEKGAVKNISAGRGTTRIVAAGDSFFLGNQMIESAANRDFAMHTINWLVDRPYLLAGVAPRSVTEYRLNLTQSEVLTVRWLLLGALPGGVLLLGVFVWFNRRK